jgi:hypothetical protein
MMMFKISKISSSVIYRLRVLEGRFGLGFFAVLAAALNCAALGAPFVPGFLMVSPDPAFILRRFAAMFE